MKVIRTILFVINIILAIGLLLTTLAPVVAPSESILPSLLAFGYLPMLAVNVLMVVVWLIMGKWHFLLSAAAIAARWSFVGLFMQVGGTSTIPDREDHPQMVTLMSYNLHNLKGPDTTITMAPMVQAPLLRGRRCSHVYLSPTSKR